MQSCVLDNRWNDHTCITAAAILVHRLASKIVALVCSIKDAVRVSSYRHESSELHGRLSCCTVGLHSMVQSTIQSSIDCRLKYITSTNSVSWKINSKPGHGHLPT